MVTRKKPSGDALIEFCRKWDESNAEGKATLAKLWDVTMDTAKHWRSESRGTVPIKSRRKVVIMEDEEDEMIVSDFLDLPTRTSLDFVSFDIETSNLRADFSILLTACIKPFGQAPTVFRADDYEFWNTDRSKDTPIVADIAHELSRHAVIVTHYGTRFDIPYMRAKLLKGGLPNLPPMFAVDTLQVARANFAVSSRRLKALARYLEMGSKTEVEGDMWMQAAYAGNRECMDEILDHNIQDCVLLEKLASVTFPYLKSIKRL